MKKYKGRMKNEYSPYEIHSTNNTIFYVIIALQKIKKVQKCEGKIMDIFQVLNIDKTKDKDIIKRAYLMKLQNTNPEDKPEEFMQLRQAYEKALEYADSPDEVINSNEKNNLHSNKSEIDIWIEKVETVYKNFKSRNDLDKWGELLKDDICQNLDSKIEARDSLLEFLMENYFIPSTLVRFLNKEFDFIGNLDDLYEKFPKAFIDNVIIYKMNNDEFPLYSLFDLKDNLDYDGFLIKFYELRDLYGEREYTKALKLYDEIKSLNIYHPELQKKLAQIYYSMGEHDKCLEVIDKMDIKYAEILEMNLLKAMALTDKGKHKEAKEYYYDILQKNPVSSRAIEGLTYIYQEEGRFLEAKGLIYGLHYNGYSDFYIDDILDNINKKIIEKYEENEDKNYDKNELIEIAWAYNENKDFDKSFKLVNSIELDKSIEDMYYALMTRIYSNLDKYDEAFDYMEKWKKSIEDVKENEITDFNRKYKCLSQVYKSKSCCYYNLKKKELALENINKSLEILPTNINSLIPKLYILYSQRKFQEVVTLCDEVLKLSPENLIVYRSKANALYDMNYYSDAFDVCEEMLEIDRYQIFPYICKARILIEVEEIDDAKEIIDFLQEEEVESEAINLLKGLISYYEGDTETAKVILEKVIEKIEENEDTYVEFNEDAYLYYIKSTYKDKTSEEIIELANKGLEYDSKNTELMYYKGWYLVEDDKLDEAQSIFEELNILDEGNSYSNDKLGDIHRKKEEYDKALEYYTKQIELEHDYEDYFSRISLNMELYNFDSVYEDLKYLESVIPESSRVYDDFGIYYSTLDKNEEALKYYLKAKSIEDSNEEKEVVYLNYRLATAYRKLKMYEEAIKCYEEDYAESEDEDALFEIYNVYMEMGDFKRGEAYLKKYLQVKELSKFSREYRYRMAMMLWQSGRLSQAKKYFSLIISYDDSQINRDKGRLYYYMNNLNKGISCLEKCLGINEVDVEEDEEEPDINAYIHAARIYKDLGCEEEAFEYANTVLNLIPKDLDYKKDELPMNYKYAGDAYAILGDLEKAERYLKKALNSPICMYCNKSKCTDAIAGLIYLEILKENMEKAKEYLEEGRKIDPSDEDIIGFGEILGC